MDLGMPEVDGFSVMKHGLSKGRCRSVVVVTGQGTIPVAVEAMRAGAADFLTKPVEQEELEQAVRRVLGASGTGALHAKERLAWRDTYCPEFIGEDPKLLEIFGVIERIADTGCHVLSPSVDRSKSGAIANSAPLPVLQICTARWLLPSSVLMGKGVSDCVFLSNNTGANSRNGNSHLFFESGSSECRRAPRSFLPCGPMMNGLPHVSPAS